MHNTYAYSDINGNITKVISLSEDEVELQLNEIDIAYAICTIPISEISKYKLIDGIFVQKTDAEILTPDYIEKQIELINNEASSIILNTFPLWKQNNMLARVIELQMNTLTPEEETEFNNLLDNWDWIKGIRNQSNVFCEQIRNATSLAEIGNHTWTL